MTCIRIWLVINAWNSIRECGLVVCPKYKYSNIRIQPIVNEMFDVSVYGTDPRMWHDDVLARLKNVNDEVHIGLDFEVMSILVSSLVSNYHWQKEYEKYCVKKLDLIIINYPSTSPSNYLIAFSTSANTWLADSARSILGSVVERDEVVFFAHSTMCL